MHCHLCWSVWPAVHVCICACVCVSCEYTLSLDTGWTLGYKTTATSHLSGFCFQLPRTRNMLALVEQGGTSLQLRRYDTISWDQQHCDNLPTKDVFFYYRFSHFKGGSCQFIFWRQRYLAYLLIMVLYGFLKKNVWSNNGSISINLGLEYPEIMQCYCLEASSCVLILDMNISKQ